MIDTPPILMLFNQTDDLVKGEPRDLIADQDVIACAHALADALTERGYRVERVPITGDVEVALAPYSPTDWVVFNLGEGLAGRLFEEARIAWAIEAMGYRFTGADAPALALSTHKGRAKEALRQAGVPTAPWRLFRDPREVTVSALGELAFPLFVKPVAEDASIGIGAGSVVADLESLRERVAVTVHRYRQAALAETFLSGAEFNIALWGPRHAPEILPLAEIDYRAFNDPSERIVGFDAKWEPNSRAYQHTPVICPANVSTELAQRLRAVAEGAWHAIGCGGYTRVDIRIAADGTPHVLEVNCNPCLAPDAGFFRCAHALGHTYADMAEQILRLAL